MRVTCPSCQATYNLDERRIPPGGAKLKCTKCQSVFPIHSAGTAEGAVPLPSSGPPPLAPRKPPEAALPLPGAARTSSSSALATPPVSMTTGVIPLPSLGLPPKEGALPRLTPSTPEARAEGLSMTTGVIPLPAMPQAPAASPAVPTAPSAPRAPERTVVFPLPKEVAAQHVPLPAPATTPVPARPLPPPAVPARAPPTRPLPPPTPPPVLETRAPTPAPAPPPALEAPAPVAAKAADLDFADAWDAAPDASAADRPSFGEVELEGGNANATDFPLPEDFEPAQPGGFAWDAPAFPPPSEEPVVPTAPPSPKPVARGPAATPAVDPLEFDPSAPPAEELEADLSAPLPRAPLKEAEPEDGLEMLGFLDEAAKESKGKRAKTARFHVRRRSGKIFGPFDVGVIAKMLEDGQLLGNEDVSTDQETWVPMGSVPGFAAVMQRLVARPEAPTPAPGTPTLSEAAAPVDLERLRQVYEGRMAVVSSMVDSDAEQTRRKKLIQLGAVAVGALLLLAAGASLGFTRYGAFGLTWLFPAHLKAGSPEAARFAAAQKALGQDSYAAVKGARTQLEGLLAQKEVPEVRAAWVQAVSQLERLYATTQSGDGPRVAAALAGPVALLGQHDVQRVKAKASVALTAHQPDAALAELALGPGADVEVALLKAEALVQKNQAPAAVQLLEPLAKGANSARLWHALGLARLAKGDAPGADAAFAQALALDASHFSSALERANLALTKGGDGPAALALLAPALEPKALATLAPAEQARALTLEGLALLATDDPDRGMQVLERATKADPSSTVARAALARAYLAKHDLEKALPLLSEAAQKDPQNAALAEALVTALLALGRPGEAQTTVTAALARLPGDARLLLLSGQVNETLDRLGEAESRYTQALAADPKNPDPSLALGRFFLRFRRNSEARAQFDALAQRLPDDPRVLVGLGDLAMADGDVARARTEFEKATAADPKFAAAWLGQSKVAIEQQRWADARLDAERALALDGNVPDGRLQRGLALWKLKDLPGALKDMEAARPSSGNLKVNVAVGAVLLEQGDLRGAESALNQALRVEPSNPEANFYVAQVHAARLEWTGAIESMRAALDRVPQRASYHYEMGKIYLGAKKVPEAIEAWKTAVKLNPKYAEAWVAIGQAEQEAQMYDDAIAAYEGGLAADPSRSVLLVAMGDCYAQTNRWVEAAARYQLALRADPKLPGVYYRLARAYAEQGDQTRALPFYVKSTLVEPSNALAFYHLGYAYKERGRRREAIAAFKAFLQKSPKAKERQEVEDEILDLQGGR
ncbi:MAG: tetratricopeptide repeat protein [Myxococcaceae bacterium]